MRFGLRNGSRNPPAASAPYTAAFTTLSINQSNLWIYTYIRTLKTIDAKLTLNARILHSLQERTSAVASWVKKKYVGRLRIVDGTISMTMKCLDIIQQKCMMPSARQLFRDHAVLVPGWHATHHDITSNSSPTGSVARLSRMQQTCMQTMDGRSLEVTYFIFLRGF